MPRPPLKAVMSVGILAALLPVLSFSGAPPDPPGTAVITVSTPPSVMINDQIGGRLLSAGRYREAADYFVRELEGNPGNLSACVGLGTAYCKMKNTGAAFRIFQECITRVPDQPDLYFGRGMCEQELGEKWLPAAEADYKKVISLQPNHPGAHNQLGLLHQARGEHPAAIAQFQAAITADPRFVVAYNNLAASLIAIGKYREAIAVLQKAILLTPDLHGLYLYTNLGIAFLYAGKPAHAEAAFLIETAINPDHLEAHLNLGNLYAVSRRYQEAINEYYRVLIAEPNHREAMINLGAVYVMTGQPQKAREILEKAVELYPDSALAHHYLALAYRALGRNEQAAFHDQRAEQLGYRPESSSLH